MIHQLFFFTAIAGTWLIGSAANAQPAKPRELKRLPIAERMTKPVAFEYKEVRLKEVVESLKELLQVPIVLDTKGLEDSAIGLEVPISGKSHGGAALDEVNELLRPAKLLSEIRNDVLFISTREKQAQNLVCHAYRIQKGGDAGAIMKLITSQVEPESWDAVGGAGSISFLPTSVLVISQTPAVHREIGKKHGKLVLLVTAPPERTAALVPTKGANPLGKVNAVLRRAATVEFPETPLREAVDWLAKSQKISLVLDEPSLIAASINANTPVTVNLKDMPLESALTLTLQDLGLTWTIDGDKILITTPEASAKKLITVNYDVRDLTGGGDFDTLIDAITSTVHPAGWQDVGGPGDIDVADGGLAIKQNVQVHRILETWLADVRTAMKPGRGK